jgi:hypothetical protein
VYYQVWFDSAGIIQANLAFLKENISFVVVHFVHYFSPPYPPLEKLYRLMVVDGQTQPFGKQSIVRLP